MVDHGVEEVFDLLVVASDDTHVGEQTEQFRRERRVLMPGDLSDAVPLRQTSDQLRGGRVVQDRAARRGGEADVVRAFEQVGVHDPTSCRRGRGLGDRFRLRRRLRFVRSRDPRRVSAGLRSGCPRAPAASGAFRFPRQLGRRLCPPHLSERCPRDVRGAVDQRCNDHRQLPTARAGDSTRSADVVISCGRSTATVCHDLARSVGTER